MAYAEAALRAGSSTGSRSAGLDSVPRTAVAPATSGETRWVRPPLPWRPSKLRLLVDALRSPGASWSGFMPRHIEQPAKRHSPPKSFNDLVETLGLGLETDPRGAGDDHHAHAVGLLRRPAITEVKARRSSIRLFVHEPMNTVSTRMSFSGVPGARSMYSIARCAEEREVSSSNEDGSGTDALSGAP